MAATVRFVTPAQLDEASTLRAALAEASSLGLAVGEWPDVIAVVNPADPAGAPQLFARGDPIGDPDGDLEGYHYAEPNGTAAMTVFNT